jgi:hypothetical protein
MTVASRHLRSAGRLMVIDKPRHRVQGAVDRAPPFEGNVFVFADGVAQMAPAARARALIWRRGRRFGAHVPTTLARPRWRLID